ncbi:hypothetical protein MAL08_12320 [Leptospira noguchii]|uniref:hypothetical protein n=1 Tax=Leptospira noguchii TaxID=28182 RepID=UPI001FB592F0|nr:hypothetical protein [Leptospira noguchii]UOG36887.1 hypothetical protein MAL08_12320 [Leptospira noguchii]
MRSKCLWGPGRSGNSDLAPYGSLGKLRSRSLRVARETQISLPTGRSGNSDLGSLWVARYV